MQACRRVGDLIDGQTRNVRSLSPYLVSKRVLRRIIYVLVVFVALRGIILIHASAIVKRLTVCLHLPFSLHDFVICDFQAEGRFRGLVLTLFNNLTVHGTVRNVRFCVLQMQAYHLRWFYEKVPVLKKLNAISQILFIAIVEIVVEV